MSHLPFNTLYARVCFILLGSIVIACSAFFMSKSDDIKIVTDLKSMTPQLFPDKKLQDVINQASSHIEDRFTLALIASDEDTLEEAVDFFIAQYNKLENNHFKLLVNEIAFTRYQTLLLEHGAHLATTERINRLQTDSEEVLYQEAFRRLYTLGSTGVFSIDEDPLGYTTEFMLALDNKNSVSPPVMIDGGTTSQYVWPLSLSAKGKALKIDEQLAIEAQINQLENSLQTNYPSVELLRSGVIFFATEAAKSAKSDITLISLASTVGVLILLLSLFRSPFPLVLPLLSIAGGIVFGLVATHWMFGSIHIITIIFGAGLIGVVVDYSLHYFYHAKQKKSDLPFLKALGFSLITSVIGYSALSLSTLSPLKHVAFFSASGLICSWITVISLGPILNSRRKDFQFHDQWAANVLRFIQQILRRITAETNRISRILVLLIGALIALAFVKTSDNPRIFFAANPELMQQEVVVSEAIGGFEPGNYFIVRGDQEAPIYTTLKSLHAEFSERGKREPMSILNFVPETQHQKNTFILYSRLYETDGVVDRLLEKQGLNKIKREQIRSRVKQQKGNYLTPQHWQNAMADFSPPLWVELGNELFAFALLPRGLDKVHARAMEEKYDNVTFVDTAGRSSDALAKQRESASQLLAIAIILIAGALALRYSSVQRSLLVLIPVTAITFTLLCFAALGIPVTLFHIMAFFLVLGLGMDYVIFAFEMADEGRSTGLAILFSALTSALSFGLLSFSDIPVVQAFGLTVLLGNTVNLVGALALLSHDQTNAP